MAFTAHTSKEWKVTALASYLEVLGTFWEATALILEGFIANPDKFIRITYQVDGSPDWKITDNVVFLNLQEHDDDYAHQRYSAYDNGVLTSKRTRVWALRCICYGSQAYEMANRLKDGFFLQSIERILTPKGVFLIPEIPTAIHAPEVFGGRWWSRWDIEFKFNEEYTITEDVGYIERASLNVTTLRQ